MTESWTEKFPIFEGLKTEVLEFLKSSAEARPCPKGEMVFQEGDLGNDLFMLEGGSVEIIRGLGGTQERHLADLTAPDFFGEMSMIECQPRSASVRATQDCQMHILLSEELYEVFTRWPDQYAILLHRFARQMARRLRSEGLEFGGGEQA